MEHLTFSPVQMPNLDGFEATKQIRQVVSSQDLPVVGLTADFLSSEMKRYTEIGMNTCLGKPIRLEVLRNCIEEFQDIEVYSGLDRKCATR